MHTTRSDYEQYEKAKAALSDKNLTPAQYDKAIRDLARSLKI